MGFIEKNRKKKSDKKKLDEANFQNRLKDMKKGLMTNKEIEEAGENLTTPHGNDEKRKMKAMKDVEYTKLQKPFVDNETKKQIDKYADEIDKKYNPNKIRGLPKIGEGKSLPIEKPDILPELNASDNLDETYKKIKKIADKKRKKGINK
jgi:hypothetical protein